jgi:hypothetical protein
MAKYQHVRGRRRGAKREPDPADLQRCLESIDRPVTGQATGSWHDGFRNLSRHNRHREAAERFARSYFARHGHLPTGTHRVVIIAKPGDGPDLDADITFA